jgi:hypothetical protein
MARTAHYKSDKTSKVKIDRIIITKNFWEYFILDMKTNIEDPNIVYAIVYGNECEMGLVDLNELKPYIVVDTNITKRTEISPPPGWVWV